MDAEPRAIVWSPSAYADLDDVLAQRDDAPEFLEEILEAAESLATLTTRGRVVPELDDPVLREIFVGRYRLIYEVSSVHVLIIAFLHTARDFETWRRERDR